MKNEQVRQTELKDWPLPEVYLTELGRLAAVWSILESQLDVCLGKVAGFDGLTDPRPFILLKHSAFPQKLDVLSALCEQLSPDYPRLREYATVVSQLRAAQKLRNKFAHNGMALNSETDRVEMAVGSARGTLKVNVETVELVDIKRAAMEVHRAMLALHGLVTGQTVPPMWERLEA
jgi:hypothetical protein